MTPAQRATLTVVVHIRRLLYRAGARPRLGSIWHSPSLSMLYGARDAGRGLAEQFAASAAQVELERQKIIALVSELLR